MTAISTGSRRCSSTRCSDPPATNAGCGARPRRARCTTASILYDDGTPQTLHQITNVTVRVEGAHATARSCFTVLQVTGQGLHPILAGDYHDRFERVDGAWRFTERIIDPRLFGDMARHMEEER